MSSALFERARQVMPGGVNSPVRAFRGVGGAPRFIHKAHGACLVDREGQELIDYILSWGPLILGHAHPKVVAAVQATAADGFSFGAATLREVELAELIVAAVDSVELVRLVCSGTEACMSALRLARGATGRERLIKFDGGYHGHADSFLVAAGSGVATFGLPDSPGVPAALAALTTSLPYGDLAAVTEAMARSGDEVAAIIVEPVAGNMGVVEPPVEFLRGLRDLCDRHGALLIFDEVMTGFRVAYGGAQARVGVRPDLTVLGKVIGGGFPLAAYGGRADLMRQIAPDGPVYQAGTLSGNPVAVAAGTATLTILRDEDPYPTLEARSAKLQQGLLEAAAAAGVPATVNRVGSMLTLFFGAEPVTDYATAQRCDRRRFASFFHAMLQAGIHLPPSQFEAWFLSTQHDEVFVARTVAMAAKALAWCVRNDWPTP